MYKYEIFKTELVGFSILPVYEIWHSLYILTELLFSVDRDWLHPVEPTEQERQVS